jgi:hypothetical protein
LPSTGCIVTKTAPASEDEVRDRRQDGGQKKKKKKKKKQQKQTKQNKANPTLICGKCAGIRRMTARQYRSTQIVKLCGSVLRHALFNIFFFAPIVSHIGWIAAARASHLCAMTRQQKKKANQKKFEQGISRNKLLRSRFHMF